MFFEMACSCSASFQIDGAEDRLDAAWLMATRFADSHINCGYMTPVVADEPEKTKRYDINRRTEDHEKEI